MSEEIMDLDDDDDVETVAADDRVIRDALIWSAVIFFIACVLVGLVAAVWLLRVSPPIVQESSLVLPEVRDVSYATVPEVAWVDITEQAGIHFQHENGSYGDKLLPETMGGGCAFFDFDGDDDQDILLVNSQRWPWDKRETGKPTTMALFANDGLGNYRDVTAESGLDLSFYGMGVAVGDYDNDADPDLFFTAVGSNRLLRNDGGRFVDATSEVGVAGGENEWSTGAAWIDYNNDGRLDLFVCNYVRWSREIDLAQDFQLVGVGRAFGPPTAFEGTFANLYRNDGKGKFTDVSADAGIQVRNRATNVPMAKSMGVAPIDVDADGWIDLVVSNDTVQNFLFHNQRDGTFVEQGALAGVAFDANGQARGAMGIDSARFRNDGSLGIAIGNFANEMSALYVSHDPSLQFVDMAIPSGLGPPTRSDLTFGLFFFDYDLDGRLDLLGANGHLEEEINKVQPSQYYEQPPQLFWNAGTSGGSELVRVPNSQLGSDFAKRMVGRGAAFADIDGDGDLDVLLTASGGPPRLLRNDQSLGHHWLRVKLIGTQCNRDAIGSWIELHAAGAVQSRQVMPTRSYLSQCELPVTFGLGTVEAADKLVVRWQDGSEQVIDGPIELDQMLAITQPSE